MKKAAIILITIVLSACQVQQEANKVEVKNNYVTNEFLVQMYDLEKISEVENKFSKNKLKAVDEVSDLLKIVLLTYDTTTISPEKMFAKLKLSGYFREIEFNKKLREREN